MQKYRVYCVDLLDSAECDDDQRHVYLASEADARIEQLEKALKACAFVLKQELGVQRTFQLIAKEALNDADKALALMVTGVGK